MRFFHLAVIFAVICTAVAAPAFEYAQALQHGTSVQLALQAKCEKMVRKVCDISDSVNDQQYRECWRAQLSANELCARLVSHFQIAPESSVMEELLDCQLSRRFNPELQCTKRLTDDSACATGATAAAWPRPGVLRTAQPVTRDARTQPRALPRKVAAKQALVGVRGNNSSALLGYDWSSFCSAVDQYLPSICATTTNCDTNPGIACAVDLYVDQINAEADLLLCNSPMGIQLTLSDAALGFSKTFAWNSAGTYGIPGLSVQIPLVGGVGAYVDYALSGVSGGINFCLDVKACGFLFGYWKCYPNPPIVLVDSTISFTDPC
jgi:hypothetical protein